MILKIFNNREQFYQYDKRQKIVIEDGDGVTHLHFTNKELTKAVAIECCDEDGKKICEIPDSLLECSGKLTVYAYCVDQCEYTKVKFQFDILPRPKPDDYVEPEEEPRWSDLEKRISDLEENSGTGGGGSVEVDSELSTESENPVQNKVITAEIDSLKESKADNIIYDTGFKSSSLPEILKEIYSMLSSGDSSGNLVDKFSITTGNNIPEIYFVGDNFSSMTKENAVDLGITINVNGFSWSGYSNTKWQGNSSLAYDKKNFTIKLYEDEAKETKCKFNWNGWGKQNKFVLKANYIDHSHCRNIISAKLWGEMVSNREDYATLPNELKSSPNNGAIDGFPIKLTVNGVYQGLYTLNIPKDGWTFNMDEDNINHAVLCAERNNNGSVGGREILACEFRDNAKIDGTDWSLEFPDDLTNPIYTSFNNLINCVKDTTDNQFKYNIGNYLDLPSAIDYYIFHYLLCGLDNLGKNLIMMTYDGTKWLCSSYDMDSLMGLYWDGSKFVSSNYQCPEQYQETNSLLWQRIESIFANDIKARWNVVKETVLSVNNIVSKVSSFMGIIGDELYVKDLEVYPSIPQGDVNHLEQITNFITERMVYVDTEISNLVQTEITEEINVTSLSLNNKTLSLSVPSGFEMIDYSSVEVEINKEIYNATEGYKTGSILTNIIELDTDNYYNFVTTQTDCGDKRPRVGKYNDDGTLAWVEKINEVQTNTFALIPNSKIKLCENDSDGNNLIDTIKLFRIKKDNLVLTQKIDSSLFDGLVTDSQGDYFVRVDNFEYGDILISMCEQATWNAVLLYTNDTAYTTSENTNKTDMLVHRNAGAYNGFGFKVKKTMIDSGYSVKYMLIKASQFNDVGSLIATLTPDNPTNQEVTWKSNDESVVVIQNDGLNATIKGLKVGTATVSCTSSDTTNGTIKDTCIVTVS